MSLRDVFNVTKENDRYALENYMENIFQHFDLGGLGFMLS